MLWVLVYPLDTPEPEMLEFSENILKADKAGSHIDLSNRFVGTLCTSGGYITGSHPKLNALARILMTFGNVHVGGRIWYDSHGVCGMVTENKLLGRDVDWKWADTSAKYIEEMSTSYGERSGVIATFYQDSYNKIIPKYPTTIESFSNSLSDKKVEVNCKQDKIQFWLSVSYVTLLVILLIVMLSKK